MQNNEKIGDTTETEEGVLQVCCLYLLALG